MDTETKDPAVLMFDLILAAKTEETLIELESQFDSQAAASCVAKGFAIDVFRELAGKKRGFLSVEKNSK